MTHADVSLEQQNPLLIISQAEAEAKNRLENAQKQAAELLERAESEYHGALAALDSQVAVETRDLLKKAEQDVVALRADVERQGEKALKAAEQAAKKNVDRAAFFVVNDVQSSL